MRLLATADAKVLFSFSFNQITFMTLEKVIELIKCGRCLLWKACHIHVVLIDFVILGSYDELMHEERTFLQEVAAMEKKFDSWSQLPAPATAAVDVKKAAGAITVSLPPAVAAFEVLWIRNVYMTCKYHNMYWASMNHAMGVDVVMSCLFALCFYHPSVINTGLLQRFLAQTGGHSGGWDDYDQQLFLKLKSKHKV